MPSRSPALADVGERLASIEASFKASEQYQHEWRHQLNNDLQPLANLPGQLARDIGKLEGSMRGEISAAVANVQKAVTGGLDRLEKRIDGHDEAIDGLKAWQNRWTGARVATLLIGQALLNAMVAIGAVLLSNGVRL